MQPPILTRGFLLLVAGHFLQALGYASMLLLPLYLGHLGASRTEIGAVMAAASVSGLVSRPLVGWAVDTLGRRPTLVAGTLTLAGGMVLIAAVTSMGPMIYASRLLAGIGEGALFTAYFVFAADLVPVSRRTEGLALFGISGLVPLVIGPLADLGGVEPAHLRWFLPGVGLLVAASLIPVFALKEPARPVDLAPWRARDAARAIAHPALWPVWLATGVFSGVVAVYMAFATVTAEARGVAEPALLWFTYTAGAVAVRTVGGRLPDRIGPRNVVSPALGSYVIAMVITAGATESGEFLLAGALAGVGHGWCFPVLMTQVVSRSPDSSRGSALAMFTALWALSAIVFTPLAGMAGDRWDDATLFALTAVSAVVGLVAWAALETRAAPTRAVDPTAST